MASDMFSIQALGMGLPAGVKAGEAQVLEAPAGAFAAALAKVEVQAASAKVGGQGLADGEVVAADGAQWAAVNVSPSLRVITDGQMDVGVEALIAFAHQQGLSPEAVQALRLQMQVGEQGALAAQKLGGTTLAVLAGGYGQATGMLGEHMRASATGLSGAPAESVSEAVDASAQLSLTAVRPSWAVPGGGASSLEAVAPNLSGVAVPSPSVMAVPVAAATAAPTAAAMAVPTAAAMAVPTQAAVVAADGDAQLPEVLDVMVRALSGDVGQTPVASRPGSTAASVGGEPALEQMPQLGVVALPTKTAFKIAAGAFSADGQQAPAGPMSDVLVLDDEVAEAVKDLMTQAPSLSRHAHSVPMVGQQPLQALTNTSTPSPAVAATPSAADLQAKYDAVAEKLGEAVGQRMQAQIQRGHWQVSLRLHPQELGSIDVQLSMRGGDLVAQFQATQQMTRDMLQDQMPRLREMLAGAGIDVASADVGSQAGGRSGGNSTPSQAGTNAAATSSNVDAGSATLDGRGSAPVSTGRDGLDLWA